MRLATRLLLVSLLWLPAGPVPAQPAADITVEEWQYLQRVKLIGDVNQKLWQAFEEQGGWNRKMAEYARDSTRLSTTKLRLWGPPATALVNFHRQFVDLLVLQDAFYDAISRSNFGEANDAGERIKRQMLDFESAWIDIQKRYE